MSVDETSPLGVTLLLEPLPLQPSSPQSSQPVRVRLKSGSATSAGLQITFGRVVLFFVVGVVHLSVMVNLVGLT
jgi:hypothetical protein